MNFLQQLLDKAAANPKTIVLSEGTDSRVIEAGIRAAKKGIANIIVIGDEHQIVAQAGTLPDRLSIENPAQSAHTDLLTQTYFQLRKRKGISMVEAQRAVLEPNTYAALLVNQGLADGSVSGAVTTTADVVRTAIQLIGKAPGTHLVSSFFLLLLCRELHPNNSIVAFADCGLVIDPNSDQLADIAITSASSFSQLVNVIPKVAMLSFSTKGSAQHTSVDKVREATNIARAKAPELHIDGELQFDAAFVPEVARAKAPDSSLRGDANVLIFPDLNSGNTAYKIAQRIGGAIALGPILQGLSKPANDLSRGCSVDDILYMIAMTAIQANQHT